MSATVQDGMQPSIVKITPVSQDDSTKPQQFLDTKRQCDDACSMNSEQCHSEYQDSDTFYLDAEIKLNSLKGDVICDADFSTKDTDPADGQQTVPVSEQSENERHTTDVNVGNIPPVVQVVKHLDHKVPVNDSRANHSCNHPQQVNLETKSLIPCGDQECKTDNQTQLPLPHTVLLAQDFRERDNFQPSQSMEEQTINSQPHDSGFDRQLPHDATALHDPKPTTPRTNPTTVPSHILWLR